MVMPLQAKNYKELKIFIMLFCLIHFYGFWKNKFVLLGYLQIEDTSNLKYLKYMLKKCILQFCTFDFL